MSIIIIYDSLCPICRTFAAILRSDLPSDWQVVAWEDFKQSQLESMRSKLDFDARELQILADDRLLVGEAAWAFLIQKAPQFRAYQNIAALIGITQPRQAQIIRLFGTILRNFCPVCHKKPLAGR